MLKYLRVCFRKIFLGLQGPLAIDRSVGVLNPTYNILKCAQHDSLDVHNKFLVRGVTNNSRKNNSAKQITLKKINIWQTTVNTKTKRRKIT